MKIVDPTSKVAETVLNDAIKTVEAQIKIDKSSKIYGLESRWSVVKIALEYAKDIHNLPIG